MPASATGRSGEKTAIMIRLDAAIADRLTQAAKRFGITRTALIVQSLTDKLFQLEKDGRI
jgi:predicted transcriptional regulator